MTITSHIIFVYTGLELCIMRNTQGHVQYELMKLYFKTNKKKYLKNSVADMKFIR